MKNQHSTTQISEMRQVECSLMHAIMLGATTGGIPAFEDKGKSFFYQGKTGSVEMSKGDGSLKVFQKGQLDPFYESASLSECVDLEHSWLLSYELGNDIRRAINKTRGSSYQGSTQHH